MESCVCDLTLYYMWCRIEALEHELLIKAETEEELEEQRKVSVEGSSCATGLKQGCIIIFEASILCLSQAQSGMGLLAWVYALCHTYAPPS